MTRKADTAPEATNIAAPPAPPLPAHPLPTEGGCWIVIDGALAVDASATPTPDPEV